MDKWIFAWTKMLPIMPASGKDKWHQTNQGNEKFINWRLRNKRAEHRIGRRTKEIKFFQTDGYELHRMWNLWLAKERNISTRNGYTMHHNDTMDFWFISYKIYINYKCHSLSGIILIIIDLIVSSWYYHSEMGIRNWRTVTNNYVDKIKKKTQSPNKFDNF